MIDITIAITKKSSWKAAFKWWRGGDL